MVSSLRILAFTGKKRRTVLWRALRPETKKQQSHPQKRGTENHSESGHCQYCKLNMDLVNHY